MQLTAMLCVFAACRVIKPAKLTERQRQLLQEFDEEGQGTSSKAKSWFG